MSSIVKRVLRKLLHQPKKKAKSVSSSSKSIESDKIDWEKRNREWNDFWKEVRAKNAFMHCTPKQLVLNGRYTKILKAFAELYGLKHEVEWSKTTFGLGLEVSVTVKNKWYHSALDVFKDGCVAYVSSMREYTQDAKAETIEEFSKKIMLGLFGEGRYLKSLHGGDCVQFVRGKDGKGYYEPVPRFELHNLPRSEEELLVKLALGGIDWESCTIQLKRSRDYG